MLGSLSFAAANGFAAGASFGPLQTLLMNVTLARGWRAGIGVALSPLLTDAVIVPLMLFLLNQLPPLFAPILRIVGGLVIFLIAWRTYREMHHPVVQTEQGTGNVSRESLFKGVLVNFTNPAPYLFWGTIMGPALLDAFRVSVLDGIGFLLTFYGIFIGLLLGFVLIFDRARGLSPRATQMLTMLSVAILIFLGASLLLQGIGGLTSAA